MTFQILMLALAIVLILEGIGPLLFPRRWKQLLGDISNQNQTVLQRLGGALMTAGIVLLIIFS